MKTERKNGREGRENFRFSGNAQKMEGGI